ncbi:MAG: FAD-binding oxidoreductase [Gammaproteobacteria bacterium]|nr:FAD-binding oxidoreductase [Gammaproteobacteria bacterium]
MDSEENGIDFNTDDRVTDWGRMHRVRVKRIVTPRTQEELRDAVKRASAEGLKIALRGSGHSAGGQSLCEDGVMIDIRSLDRLIEVNEAGQTATVQTGADWAVMTRALEPLRLAVATKQEFDTFTIGGSLACNVHGKTIDYGPLIETTDSFRLLTAGGDIINVSRTENAELFPAVIGGYGLFGIVVDATFKLVTDRVVEKTEVVYMNAEPLIASYIERIKRGPALCYGFLNEDCSRGYYVTYDAIDDSGFELSELKRDELNPRLFNKFIALQRHSKMLRERAFHFMWAGSNRPEVTLESRRLLLWDKGPRAFDDMLLQKYFVPIGNFSAFLAEIRPLFARFGDELPLLTNHFRYVPGNDESLMAFAPQDAICLIPCYLARKDDAGWYARLKEATEQLIDIVLQHGGTYYLTFDSIPTCSQFQAAYPNYNEFFALKRKHDPEERFSSLFYEKYTS